MAGGREVWQKEKEAGWPPCTWEAGSEEELGPGYTDSRPAPGDSLLPARLPVLMVPQPSPTAPPAGSQVSKHSSLWVSFLFQRLTKPHAPVEPPAFSLSTGVTFKLTLCHNVPHVSPRAECHSSVAFAAPCSMLVLQLCELLTSSLTSCLCGLIVLGSLDPGF